MRTPGGNQLYGRRNAAKKLNMSRAATALQATRNHIDIRVSPRRLLRVREQCGIDMTPRESGCKAQAEASRANGSRIAVQLLPCDENGD